MKIFERCGSGMMLSCIVIVTWTVFLISCDEQGFSPESIIGKEEPAEKSNGNEEQVSAGGQSEEGPERETLAEKKKPAERLKKKMTMEVVLKHLGKPKNKLKGASGGTKFEMWRYPDGLVLTFLNNKLEKWERKERRVRQPQEDSPERQPRQPRRSSGDEEFEFKRTQPAPF
ncbi:MAG: hypothetical protein ACLFWL_08270 [Candidatus Brocadiia bacterium]